MAKDLFSKQAGLYASHRPGYPQALADYILSFVHEKNRAWDCATGNGQAAILFAPHFQEVEATDISARQISHAQHHPSILYSVGSMENNGFPDNHFNLITVAQAYHWFSFDVFHREAMRTGKPGCIIAVWGYGLVQTTHPAIQEAIRRFYTDIVGKYWDPERRYVDEAYQTVPFAFKRLPGRSFVSEKRWSRQDLAGYLHTWSSVQHFINANGFDPVDDFEKDLPSLWPGPDTLTFSFPIFLLLGQVEKPA
ncbi:MAG TPA: class I SAM-dependent methyltransferase [Puia sp.]|nr:class I SAM-dependent methyltransferase [Puia sp.]